MALQQLTSCRKQAEQMEQEVARLSLSAGAKVRLEALLRAAKESLAEAEQLMKAEKDNLPESAAKLQLWERKLLDLSLRNNLLNMKLGKNAIPIHKSLATTHTSTANSSVIPDIDISILEDELDRGKEFVLEQKELKPIYRAVRTNLEESGANTLFLTLGSLCWNERAGGKVYSAPILLMPIEIVPLKKDRYAIRKRDEDLMLNITLMEMLRQQYDIEVEGVSPLPQDAHGIDVSLVLHLVRDAVKEHEEWKVVEDCVLGIFSFTRFVMWNDINTHSTTMMENPIIRSLIEGRRMMENAGEAVDARGMDRTVRPEEMAIPVDADSSQLEAVAESVRGNSFILYGPPGTGKSQTITNLIANAMYHGKRILFVAEKKAALDVVQSRLAKIGLAPFCLELHSNKMDKQHFLRQMQAAIDATGATPPEEFQRTANALYAQRMQLIDYVEALHRPLTIGLSLYDCINRYLSIEAQPLQLPKDFTKELTAERLEGLCEGIKALDSGKSMLGMEPQAHPLYGLIPKPKQPQKSAYAMMQDTLEKILPQLPQIVDGIGKQIEHGKSMKFMHKTTRQYVEADYKWKKFAALARVNDALLDDFDALQAAVTRWSTAVSELPIWEQYTGLTYALETAGLSEAVALYGSGVQTAAICQSFRAACYQQAALDAIQSDPGLSQFNGMLFSQVIEKYNALTREFQQLTRKELVARMAAQIPANTRDPQLSGELTLLRKRIANKGRGTSIRCIIEQMPALLPRLCPVMLMSPLSVAQYLEMEGPKFDLVVFDEASQMPTGEAVGAICRGKATIVVGDPKQMPPTSFFSVNLTEEDEADMDDLESILDDCISLSMPSRYLGWHYRSKHESLIAFSNQNYYEGRLVTFPSADDMVPHVTWQHVEGFYDYGKTRTNRAEAEAIVAEAVCRMQKCPERSIGIVAFSKQQSDLIEDVFNEQMVQFPDLEIRNRESEEPLFIKNLENVQGDERDIILFSVGYGPDRDGKVSMNFGPLNKAGGERRLNVAVSRARYEMKIFSTLRPEQIDERRTQSEGVLGLKRFLRFAQQGVLLPKDGEGTDGATKTDMQQPMIAQLADAIRRKGYEVHTGVGTSAFRVDVAVVDPVNREHYLLGIICDGHNYYRLKTARDREVVQPTVLRLLGWNLMHVWSVDWMLRPESIIDAILQHLK